MELVRRVEVGWAIHRGVQSRRSVFNMALHGKKRGRGKCRMGGLGGVVT